MTVHQFGGPWTERKLQALTEYLAQYQPIFHANQIAQEFQTTYVDAFAGTGERDARNDADTLSLFGYEIEVSEFQEGSVKRALGLEKKFHKYVFIDNKPSHIAKINAVIAKDFPDVMPRCEVRVAEANAWLTD